MNKGRGFLIAGLALWAATFAVEAAVGASARKTQWFKERQSEGSPAAVRLAGAFKITAANLLWVKADNYHEQWERRGLDWTADTEVFPLFRACTYLDPHFVEVFVVHGHLLDAQKKHDAALAMYQEGLKNNPRRYELYEAIALHYARRVNDPKASLPYFARAAELAPDPFDQKRLARTVRILDARLNGKPEPKG